MTPVASEIGRSGSDPSKHADAKKGGFKVSPLAIETPYLDLTTLILAYTSHFYGHGAKVSSFSC